MFLAAACDPDDILFLFAEAEFSGVEQPIDNIIVTAHPVVDQLRFTFRTSYKKRRRFTNRYARRKSNERLPSIVELSQHDGVTLFLSPKAGAGG